MITNGLSECIPYARKCAKWLPAASALLAGILLAGCARADKVSADGNLPTAAVAKVARRDLSNTMEISSEFEPNQEIEVYAKVSGYIQELHVDWGTHVRQGQLLAVLDVPELQQQLQQDEASVRRSQSDLARAQEEVKADESAYSVAHVTYGRLADVQKTQPGLVAQQDIDVSQGKDLEAGNSLAASKDAVAAAQQAVAAANATLAKDQAMYSYARITAPFDGVVTEMHAFTGALLPAGTSSNIGGSALCRLSQNDLLRLVIPVPERAVADIHLGQTVAVKVSALNKTYSGKIARVSDQIDTQTRTMHTEVEISNPKYELIPGMYASVNIPLHQAEAVLTVPLQTVQASGDGRGTVLVVNGDNKIERRNVILGIETATQAEVVSGLKENEMVVVGEQGQYQPGQEVRPQIAESSELE
jgi:RND family efflux transporter MFP subunit